jgi:hypothetical protein
MLLLLLVDCLALGRYSFWVGTRRENGDLVRFLLFSVWAHFSCFYDVVFACLCMGGNSIGSPFLLPAKSGAKDGQGKIG